VGLVLPREIANLAHLDVSLLLTTLAVSVIASVLAAAYPTFRAARVVPAWQLKSN
jgi:putative ABC transport system permease protein